MVMDRVTLRILVAFFSIEFGVDFISFTLLIPFSLLPRPDPIS